MPQALVRKRVYPRVAEGPTRSCRAAVRGQIWDRDVRRTDPECLVRIRGLQMEGANELIESTHHNYVLVKLSFDSPLHNGAIASIVRAGGHETSH